MKKIAFFSLCFLLFFACKKSNDVVVAEAWGNKLYLSEIKEMMPSGLSPTDSADFISRYVQNWNIEKIVLHEANQQLHFYEKDFSTQINQLRKQLLINAYYDKITEDSTLFSISNQEIQAFMENYGMNEIVEKEIIKINYVKLSLNSPLIPPIKNILFDEEKRINEKSTIEKLCGDSIEYFIEDDKWLYLDDIEIELPFQLTNKNALQTENRYIETKDKYYHYIIVLLDYRDKQTTNEVSPSEYDNIRAMLQQQKKNKFIRKHIEQLYQRALREKKISN